MILQGLRSSEERSLQAVNEYPRGKRNAAKAFLDNYFSISTVKVAATLTSSRVTVMLRPVLMPDIPHAVS